MPSRAASKIKNLFTTMPAKLLHQIVEGGEGFMEDPTFPFID